MNKVDLSKISGNVLLLNVYITQGIVLLISIIGIAFFQPAPLQESLYYMLITDSIWKDLLLGGLAGFGIVFVQVILKRLLPEHFFDDGGINEKLFTYLRAYHIIFISLVVAFAEELLFRGFIQNQIGILASSIIFTLIHFRYIHQGFMITFVFALSILLGYIYILSGSLIAPMIAHFLIDAILGLFIHYNCFSLRAGKTNQNRE